jgi:tetratricopeptide (TPR) repeat protein
MDLQPEMYKGVKDCATSGTMRDCCGIIFDQKSGGSIVMTTSTARIVITLVVAALLSPIAHADGSDASAATAVRDDAISKIVAWRAKSGEATLKRKSQLEESQPWLTAEALLMATYGIGQDQKLVDEALEILKAQTKKDPDDPVSQFYYGQVLSWTDQKEAAQKAWQSSKQRAAAMIKKNSRDGLAQYYLGASLVMLRKPAEARKALKKAIKYDFDKPMADFQIGLSYLLDENWKAAKASFDDVHELDPRFAHLYFYRGLAWDKLGHKDRLLDDLDQFVKLAPNSNEAKTARAILNR